MDGKIKEVKDTSQIDQKAKSTSLKINPIIAIPEFFDPQNQNVVTNLKILINILQGRCNKILDDIKSQKNIKEEIKLEKFFSFKTKNIDKLDREMLAEFYRIVDIFQENISNEKICKEILMTYREFLIRHQDFYIFLVLYKPILMRYINNFLTSLDKMIEIFENHFIVLIFSFTNRRLYNDFIKSLADESDEKKIFSDWQIQFNLTLDEKTFDGTKTLRDIYKKILSSLNLSPECIKQKLWQEFCHSLRHYQNLAKLPANYFIKILFEKAAIKLLTNKRNKPQLESENFEAKESLWAAINELNNVKTQHMPIVTRIESEEEKEDKDNKQLNFNCLIKEDYKPKILTKLSYESLMQELNIERFIIRQRNNFILSLHDFLLTDGAPLTETFFLLQDHFRYLGTLYLKWSQAWRPKPRPKFSLCYSLWSQHSIIENKKIGRPFEDAEKNKSIQQPLTPREYNRKS